MPIRSVKVYAPGEKQGGWTGVFIPTSRVKRDESASAAGAAALPAEAGDAQRTDGHADAPGDAPPA